MFQKSVQASCSTRSYSLEIIPRNPLLAAIAAAISSDLCFIYIYFCQVRFFSVIRYLVMMLIYLDGSGSNYMYIHVRHYLSRGGRI